MAMQATVPASLIAILLFFWLLRLAVAGVRWS